MKRLRLLFNMVTLTRYITMKNDLECFEKGYAVFAGFRKIDRTEKACPTLREIVNREPQNRITCTKCWQETLEFESARW